MLYSEFIASYSKLLLSQHPYTNCHHGPLNYSSLNSKSGPQLLPHFIFGHLLISLLSSTVSSVLY